MKSIKLTKNEILTIFLKTGNLRTQFSHQANNDSITSQIMRLDEFNAARLSNDCFEAGETELAIKFLRLF